VKEHHFNILVLASALAPFVVMMFSRARMVTKIAHSVALQSVFVLYGTWFWKRMDAWTEGCFSFENELKIRVLLVTFAVSLALFSAIRLGIDRYMHTAEKN
jgi:hypothetical protein